jgi:hypothetical protein
VTKVFRIDGKAQGFNEYGQTLYVCVQQWLESGDMIPFCGV